MDYDLKLIKKKYGEAMAKLCREFFPTLLEKDGLLSTLMLNHFEPNRSLYQDIINQKLEEKFKNYIYSLVNVENNNKISTNKTPKELLNEVGYNLYECETEDEIQQFKKYYAKGEELCTFRGGRLNRCRVFFAVKKDVNEINRWNYQYPKRQDKYGTSVISIQFTKDPSHTLSIKNRYNHRVNNPDSTFSNNLDNIIEGLTESFERVYGLVQHHKNDFEIKGYTMSNDGKYYKYNQEINNIYYCPNNIIIDNYEVKRYEKEKYIIMDYFIIDLVNKKISLYDEEISDTFLDTIKDIEKIEIERKEKEKLITIKVNNGEDIKLVLNKNNEMIKLTNPNIEKIENKFLRRNKSLQELTLQNIQKIGDHFLSVNNSLKKVNMPKLQKIGDGFLYGNSSLQILDLSNLCEVGNDFLHNNDTLKKVNLPNIQKIGARFLYFNHSLLSLTLPNLKEVGDNFLYFNRAIEEINLPNLQKVRDKFLYFNNTLKEVDLPNLQEAGHKFLCSNNTIQKLNLPNLRIVGDDFLYLNTTVKIMNFPSLEKVGNFFLASIVSRPSKYSIKDDDIKKLNKI